MLDWKGNTVEKNHRTKIILYKVEDNKAMSASVQVSGIESRTINRALETSDYKEDKVKTYYGNASCAADEVLSIIGAVSPLLDNMALYEHLSARLELGNLHALLGSTYAPDKDYLIEEIILATNPSTDVTNDD